MDFDKELQTAIQATKKAGEFIETNFDKLTTIATKNEFKEIVTDLDIKSEDIILSTLRRAFPEYGVVSEESPDKNLRKELTWIIDPLDGTANLALGLPLVAVSIALQKYEETVMGVVYHPIRHHHYKGLLGAGSFLDDHEIHVSSIDTLEQAQVGHIVSFEEKYKPRALELVTSLRSQCRRMLDTWTPSMEWTLLAQGKIDALISLGSGVYDRLAGELIVKEAGGIVTDLQGKAVTDDSINYILASNNTALHQKILNLVGKHY